MRVVAGATQTDFVSSDVDKGASVSFLAGLLGSPGAEDAPQLALAVGDAGTDLPMLRLAKLPFAPANATGEVRRATGVHVLGRPYQSGLALAVERLIGHPLGRCPMCLPPELTPEANTVLAIISAQEQGLGGLARGFVELLLRAGP